MSTQERSLVLSSSKDERSWFDKLTMSDQTPFRGNQYMQRPVESRTNGRMTMRTTLIKAVTMACIGVTGLLPDAFALTSGPTQPEYSGFTPVNREGMVDLLSGDFSYALPLMEVPGPSISYPITLGYRSGVQLEQEASWVGLGWSLNEGSINRSTNRYPDDYAEGRQRSTFKGDKAITGWDVNIGVSYQGMGVAANIGSRSDQGMHFGLDVTVLGQSVDLFDYNQRDGWGLIDNQPSVAGFALGMVDYVGNKAAGAGIGAASEAMGTDLEIGSASVSIGALSMSISGNMSSTSTNVGSFHSQSFGSPTLGVKIGNYVNVSGSFRMYKNWISKEEDNRLFGYLYLGQMPPEENDGGSNNDYGTEHMKMEYSFAPEWTPSMMSKTRNIFDNWYRSKAFALSTPDVYSVRAEGVSGAFRPYRQEIGDYFGMDRHEANVNEIINWINGKFFAILIQGFLDKQKAKQINFLNEAVAQYATQFIDWNNSSYDGKYNDGSNMPLPGVMFRMMGEPGGAFVGETWRQRLRSGGPDDYDPSNSVFIDDVRAAETALDFRQRSNSSDDNYAGEGSYTLPFMPRLLNGKLTYDNDGTNYVPDRLATATGIFPVFKDPANPDDALLPLQALKGFVVVRSDGYRYEYLRPVLNFFTRNYSKTRPENADEARKYNQSDFGDYKSSNSMERSYAYSWLLTGIKAPDFFDISGPGQINDGDIGGWMRFEYGSHVPSYHYRTPYAGLAPSGVATDSKSKGAYYSSYGEAAWGAKEIYYLTDIYSPTHHAKFTLAPRDDGREAALTADDFGWGEAGGNKYIVSPSLAVEVGDQIHCECTYYRYPVVAEDVKANPSEIGAYSADFVVTGEVTPASEEVVHNGGKMLRRLLVSGPIPTISSDDAYEKIGVLTGVLETAEKRRITITSRHTEPKLQKVTRIDLYRRTFNQAADEPEPVRFVELGYETDASKALCPGIPNTYAVPVSNAALPGKLTLRSVQMGFPGNNRLPKYEFSYHKEGNEATYDRYHWDRWGYYKHDGGLVNTTIRAKNIGDRDWAHLQERLNGTDWFAGIFRTALNRCANRNDVGGIRNTPVDQWSESRTPRYRNAIVQALEYIKEDVHFYPTNRTSIDDIGSMAGNAFPKVHEWYNLATTSPSTTNPVMNPTTREIRNGLDQTDSNIVHGLNLAILSEMVLTRARDEDERGTVLREIWWNMPGEHDGLSTLTGDPRYPQDPDQSIEIGKAEAITSSWSNQINFGTRLRGCIYLPTTAAPGVYTFSIDADDRASLYISTSSNPADVVRVACSDNDGCSSSDDVTMQPGQRYYFEVLHRQKGDGSSLTVKWQGPGMTERVLTPPYIALPDKPMITKDLDADRFDHETDVEDVVAWSLKSVRMPSGADLSIDYESDDFSYIGRTLSADPVVAEGTTTKDNKKIENLGYFKTVSFEKDLMGKADILPIISFSKDEAKQTRERVCQDGNREIRDARFRAVSLLRMCRNVGTAQNPIWQQNKDFVKLKEWYDKPESWITDASGPHIKSQKALHVVAIFDPLQYVTSVANPECISCGREPGRSNNGTEGYAFLPIPIDLGVAKPVDMAELIIPTPTEDGRKLRITEGGVPREIEGAEAEKYACQRVAAEFTLRDLEDPRRWQFEEIAQEARDYLGKCMFGMFTNIIQAGATCTYNIFEMPGIHFTYNLTIARKRDEFDLQEWQDLPMRLGGLKKEDLSQLVLTKNLEGKILREAALAGKLNSCYGEPSSDPEQQNLKGLLSWVFLEDISSGSNDDIVPPSVQDVGDANEGYPFAASYWDHYGIITQVRVNEPQLSGTATGTAGGGLRTKRLTFNSGWSRKKGQSTLKNTVEYSYVCEGADDGTKFVPGMLSSGATPSEPPPYNNKGDDRPVCPPQVGMLKAAPSVSYRTVHETRSGKGRIIYNYLTCVEADDFWADDSANYFTYGSDGAKVMINGAYNADPESWSFFNQHHRWRLHRLSNFQGLMKNQKKFDAKGKLVSMQRMEYLTSLSAGDICYLNLIARLNGADANIGDVLLPNCDDVMAAGTKSIGSTDYRLRQHPLQQYMGTRIERYRMRWAYDFPDQSGGATVTGVSGTAQQHFRYLVGLNEVESIEHSIRQYRVESTVNGVGLQKVASYFDFFTGGPLVNSDLEVRHAASPGCGCAATSGLCADIRPDLEQTTVPIKTTVTIPAYWVDAYNNRNSSAATMGPVYHDPAFANAAAGKAYPSFNARNMLTQPYSASTYQNLEPYPSGATGQVVPWLDKLKDVVVAGTGLPSALLKRSLFLWGLGSDVQNKGSAWRKESEVALRAPMNATTGRIDLTKANATTDQIALPYAEPSVFLNSPVYVRSKQYTAYDQFSHALEIRDAYDSAVTMIYDNNRHVATGAGLQLVGQVLNADRKSCAVLTFDEVNPTTPVYSPWTVGGTLTSAHARSGSMCVKLEGMQNVRIALPEAASGREYELSFWVRRGGGDGWYQVDIDGAYKVWGTIFPRSTGPEWSMGPGDRQSVTFTVDKTSNGKVAIVAFFNAKDNSVLYVDDVRLAPTNAQVHTMTYDQNGYMTSYAGPNDVISSYRYDAFGRLTEVKDHEGVIVSTQAQLVGKR